MSTDNSPQLENGYLRIANELYEAILKFQFSKRELLVVLSIIRKTYGYGKKKDDISLSQITNMTNIRPEHVSRTVNHLSVIKVLLKQQGKYSQNIELNKKYGEWLVLPKQQPIAKTAIVDCQNSNSAIADSAIDPLPKQQSQKTTPKDNSKRQLTKNSLGNTVTGPVWEAYSVAYENRYKAKPVRNAMVNGQLANLIKRVGAEETPHIAAFYLTHNNAFYVTKMHPIGLLLQDAEKLRTEWATNTQITATKAKQTDRKQSNLTVFEEVSRERGYS